MRGASAPSADVAIKVNPAKAQFLHRFVAIPPPPTTAYGNPEAPPMTRKASRDEFEKYRKTRVRCTVNFAYGDPSCRSPSIRS